MRVSATIACTSGDEKYDIKYTGDETKLMSLLINGGEVHMMFDRQQWDAFRSLVIDTPFPKEISNAA